MHDDGQETFFLCFAIRIPDVCSVVLLEKQRFLSRPSTLEGTF